MVEETQQAPAGPLVPYAPTSAKVTFIPADRPDEGQSGTNPLLLLVGAAIAYQILKK
jgi:hypothetical protein